MSEKVNDPRRERIKFWRDYYESKYHHEPDITWPVMMNMMFRKFETVDLKTGELLIDYPKQEGWARETEGFFIDPYALKTHHFFGYFLKQYGSFGQPPKRNVMKLVSGLEGQFRTPLAQNKNEEFRCGKCGNIHSPKLQCGG